MTIVSFDAQSFVAVTRAKGEPNRSNKMSAQLADMLVAQRSYQANTTLLQTAERLLGHLDQLA